MSNYDYTDTGNHVRLIHPDRDREFRDYQRAMILMGREADVFRQEIERMESTWEHVGNPNPRKYESQQDHLNFIISVWFGECNE